MVTEIFIGNTKVDLSKDENIDFNSSVANTDDITKINTDFTKSFTVPASDRNNFLFKHYYDADIDNTFDARTKVKGEIKISGFPFRIGKFRLEKVSVKDGKPANYTINFFGDLVNIKDLIGEDELTSLDLQALDHSPSVQSIQIGLEQGLFNRDIVYNLINTRKQFFYNSTPNYSNPLQLLTTNVGTTKPFGEGVDDLDLFPSVRISKILEAISTKYGLTFSNEFTNRTEFKEAYMWACNNTVNKILRTSFINFTTGGGTFMNLATDSLNFTTFVNSVNDKKRFYFKITILNPIINNDNDTLPIDFAIFNNGVQVALIQDQTPTFEREFTINTNDVVNNKYQFQINIPIDSATVVCRSESWNGSSWIPTPEETSGGISQGSEALVNVSANLPKLKIIEFLSGLFKIFKLVAIPQRNGTIYLNTANDYYLSGKVVDLTKHFDIKNYDAERGTLARQIDFKFQPPTTILNQQFKQNNIVAYGDSLLTLKDNELKPLDGDVISVELPFETLLFERLKDVATNNLVNIQYGLSRDLSGNQVVPKPILFYNNVVQLGTTKVKMFRLQTPLNTTLNTPSNTLGLDNVSNSLIWSNEFSTWNGALINNTLYSNYWQKYVVNLFNIKKRNFKFKAKLPKYLLTNIELNDIVELNKKYYRINDYNVNLLTGDATFNLINNFETNFGLFSPTSKEIYVNYLAQTTSVYVSNASVMNISIQNLGFGTEFITAVKNGNFIEITFTENTLTLNRDAFINVNNGAGKSFQLYVNQDNKIVTADSTEVTADNNILTIDAQ
jgi:hypothetical protein